MDQAFHFGRWLKRAIEDLGIRQVDFAKKAGVGFGALRIWIRQQAPNPRGFLIVRMALALSVSREQIEAKLAEARAAATEADREGSKEATESPAAA